MGLSYPHRHRPSLEAGDFELGGPGLRPPHRLLSHRVFPAVHGLEIEAGLYKFDVEKHESDFF